jgi:hypothetical protein
MVRVSLEALLPGMEDASGWLARAAAGLPAGVLGPRRVAHVLAGNTPLLAWPGLAACLLAGSHSVVKMSRDETLWPRRFVESLALSTRTSPRRSRSTCGPATTRARSRWSGAPTP